MTKFIALAAAGLLALSGPLWAESWTLDGAASKLSFGSVKKHYIGEVHHFTELSGSVSDTGAAEITINLASLETWIDIRNERMGEHVFNMAPKALLTAQLDMPALEALEVGATLNMESEGTLSLLGEDIYVPLEAIVARLGADKVMVSTDIIYVATDELGIDGGIDKLKELAELPDITRAVPVVLRLVFTASDSGA